MAILTNIQNMFYEEIRIKQGLSYISFSPLRILYNSKFIIMATSGNKCCRCNEGSLYDLNNLKEMYNTITCVYLQVKNIIYHAVKDAVAVLMENDPDDEN